MRKFLFMSYSNSDKMISVSDAATPQEHNTALNTYPDCGKTTVIKFGGYYPSEIDKFAKARKLTILR